MRTPLARQNLMHNLVRTMTAATGVAFAVVLVFMQLGFLGSVETTVTRFFDALDFDLLVRSPKYLHLSDPRSFPRARLNQVAEIPGVKSVTPLLIGMNRWRSPIPPHKRRGILVIGLPAAQPAFVSPEIHEKAPLLTDPSFVLIDRRSRAEFGPRNGEAFSDLDLGTRIEVNGQGVEIVGHFALGTGLSADGAILTNTVGFQRIVSQQNPEDVNFGLVRLKSGTDARTVAESLRQQIGRGLSNSNNGKSDIEVFTRDEVIQYELDRWVSETSIGIIFQLGVIVSLTVGTVVVFQVLSSDIASHLRQYATLKAMGYTNRYLSGVVLAQAIGLALLGFAPGLILAEILYRITSSLANIPIVMNGGRIFGVLLLTVAICALAGMAALRKVWLADPATLF